MKEVAVFIQGIGGVEKVEISCQLFLPPNVPPLY